MSDLNTRRSHRILLVSAILLPVTLIPVAAESQEKAQTRAPTATGTCAPNELKYKVAEYSVSTSSTTFVNVPDSALTISPGVLGCVIVSFSATAAAPASTAMFVEPHIGNVPCRPTTNVFVISNATATANADRAMTFVCLDVPAGLHTIRMKYASSNGNAVFLDRRTLLVHYRK